MQKRLLAWYLVASLVSAACAGCGTASPSGWQSKFGALRRPSRGTLLLTPLGPPATAPSVTHSALALSRASLGDLSFRVEVVTEAQLRRPDPNPWEVGWVLWHYRDNQHFYYLALKPNGWEVGKEDPAEPGDQRFLQTGDSPQFPIGVPYRIRIVQRAATVRIFVDDRLLTAFADPREPYLIGRSGLYVEDATARFSGVSLRANSG